MPCSGLTCKIENGAPANLPGGVGFGLAYISNLVFTTSVQHICDSLAQTQPESRHVTNTRWHRPLAHRNSGKTHNRCCPCGRSNGAGGIRAGNYTARHTGRESRIRVRRSSYFWRLSKTRILPAPLAPTSFASSATASLSTIPISVCIPWIRSSDRGQRSPAITAP